MTEKRKYGDLQSEERDLVCDRIRDVLSESVARGGFRRGADCESDATLPESVREHLLGCDPCADFLTGLCLAAVETDEGEEALASVVELGSPREKSLPATYLVEAVDATIRPTFRPATLGGRLLRTLAVGFLVALSALALHPAAHAPRLIHSHDSSGEFVQRLSERVRPDLRDLHDFLGDRLIRGFDRLIDSKSGFHYARELGEQHGDFASYTQDWDCRNIPEYRSYHQNLWTMNGILGPLRPRDGFFSRVHHRFQDLSWYDSGRHEQAEASNEGEGRQVASPDLRADPSEESQDSHGLIESIDSNLLVALEEASREHDADRDLFLLVALIRSPEVFGRGESMRAALRVLDRVRSQEEGFAARLLVDATALTLADRSRGEDTSPMGDLANAFIGSSASLDDVWIEFCEEARDALVEHGVTLPDQFLDPIWLRRPASNDMQEWESLGNRVARLAIIRNMIVARQKGPVAAIAASLDSRWTPFNLMVVAVPSFIILFLFTMGGMLVLALLLFVHSGSIHAAFSGTMDRGFTALSAAFTAALGCLIGVQLVVPGLIWLLLGEAANRFLSPSSRSSRWMDDVPLLMNPYELLVPTGHMFDGGILNWILAILGLTLFPVVTFFLAHWIFTRFLPRVLDESVRAVWFFIPILVVLAIGVGTAADKMAFWVPVNFTFLFLVLMIPLRQWGGSSDRRVVGLGVVGCGFTFFTNVITVNTLSFGVDLVYLLTVICVCFVVPAVLGYFAAHLPPGQSLLIRAVRLWAILPALTFSFYLLHVGSHIFWMNAALEQASLASSAGSAYPVAAIDPSFGWTRIIALFLLPLVLATVSVRFGRRTAPDGAGAFFQQPEGRIRKILWRLPGIGPALDGNVGSWLFGSLIWAAFGSALILPALFGTKLSPGLLVFLCILWLGRLSFCLLRGSYWLSSQLLH